MRNFYRQNSQLPQEKPDIRKANAAVQGFDGCCKVEFKNKDIEGNTEW